MYSIATGCRKLLHVLPISSPGKKKRARRAGGLVLQRLASGERGPPRRFNLSANNVTKTWQNAPYVRVVAERALTARRLRLHEKSFRVAQENLKTPPTTMGRDRRKATLGFGGWSHFP